MSTRFQRLSRLILITTLFITLIAGLIPTAAQDDVPWPTSGWLTSTPEEQGVDSAKLLALLDEIERQDITLDSLMVIRHGHIVMDAYFWPFERVMKHNMYSTTKSFTSALVGVAMQQGYITSVDQPVLELLPGYTAGDPGWSEITLRDALTMSTGADCTADPLWHDTDDWTQDILNLSVSSSRRWQYCSFSPQLVSSIVGKTTGTPSADFAREYLLKPLGITEYDWPVDPQGNVISPTDLMLTPHDMAKLGYLYLHEGRWENQQIIPAQYVQESACLVEDTSYCKRGSPIPYGYLWWILPANTPTYSTVGIVAQLIMVVPERDLVIVVTAHGLRPDIAGYVVPTLIANKVAEAAVSETALPANRDTEDQLVARIEALAQQPAGGESVPVPEAARALSGLRLELDSPLDFASVYWYFLYPRWDPREFPATRQQVQAIQLTTGDNADEVTFGLEFADGYTVDVVVGLDGAYRTTESRFGVLAAMGRWGIAPNGDVTLLINDMHVVGEGRANDFYVSLSQDPIQVTSHCVTTAYAVLGASVRQ